MSAISQNRPRRVEIKGFKTSHFLEGETALLGLFTTDHLKNLKSLLAKISSIDLKEKTGWF
jgi:hypothetical protein